MNTTTEPLIVTRHEALVTVLSEDYKITGDVMPHAGAEEVRGRHVVGVLPLHLAAEAATLTVVDLQIPPDVRGRELTTDEVRRFSRGLVTYRVEKLSAHPV